MALPNTENGYYCRWIVEDKAWQEDAVKSYVSDAIN
jgi:hypothetical protein